MARLIGLLAAALLVGVGGLLPGPATHARAPAVTPAGAPTDTVVATIAVPTDAARRVVHGT